MRKDKENQEEKRKELLMILNNYIELNNNLIEEFWDIELKISQSENSKENEKLMAKRNQIAKEIEQKNYEEKINQLFEEIKALEIKLYGYSHIGSGSPYQDER